MGVWSVLNADANVEWIAKHGGCDFRVGRQLRRRVVHARGVFKSSAEFNAIDARTASIFAKAHDGDHRTVQTTRRVGGADRDAASTSGDRRGGDGARRQRARASVRPRSRRTGDAVARREDARRRAAPRTFARNDVQPGHDRRDEHRAPDRVVRPGAFRPFRAPRGEPPPGRDAAASVVPPRIDGRHVASASASRASPAFAAYPHVGADPMLCP